MITAKTREGTLLYHKAHVRACVCISGSDVTDHWRKGYPKAEVSDFLSTAVRALYLLNKMVTGGHSKKIYICRYLPVCMAPFPYVKKFSVFTFQISNISDFYIPLLFWTAHFLSFLFITFPHFIPFVFLLRHQFCVFFVSSLSVAFVFLSLFPSPIHSC